MLPYINIPFDYLASLLGASTDELKLIFSFLVSYPLAGVLKRIPDRKPHLKNGFIIAVSLFYLIGLFDLWTGLRTLFVSASGAYLIATFIQGAFMPWIGFVFLMGHLSMSHLIRQGEDDASAVEISGAQMVMVMKLTAFCWNVADGRLKKEDLSDFQKARALPQLPPVLDYVAYVLFFPSLFAGPAFDYVDYRDYITTTMFDLPPGTDPAKAPPTRKKRKIPRSGTPATIKALIGLAWVLLFLVMSGLYNSSIVLDESYMQYNFFRRVWILHMFGFTTRMKYYGVWHLTEGACILSGIGYNGVDPKTGRANWDRLQNVRPWRIESAQNSRDYLGFWNINTNNWLRNYTYLRVTPKGKKPGFQATLATFLTSAFWHGFYPGYYLTFVLAALLQTIMKRTRRLIRPFFLQPGPNSQTPTPQKRYYDIATWLITQAAFSFTVSPFILLSFSGSMTVWARVYFYTVVGTVACFAFMYSPAAPMLKKRLEARNRAAADAGRREGTGADPASPTKPPAMERTVSTQGEPVLGLPDDPEQEVNDIVRQVREEIEKRGQNDPAVQRMPDIGEVRKIVEEKLGRT